MTEGGQEDGGVPAVGKVGDRDGLRAAGGVRRATRVVEGERLSAEGGSPLNTCVCCHPPVDSLGNAADTSRQREQSSLKRGIPLHAETPLRGLGIPGLNCSQLHPRHQLGSMIQSNVPSANKPLMGGESLATVRSGLGSTT